MQTMRLKKAENFMKDARVLLHNERCDSCVSRCYYALYHLMIALLEKQGVRSKEWSHQFVPSEFGRIFVHRKKIFPAHCTAFFYDIQKDRNEADYNVQPVSFKRAKRTLQTFDKTQNLWNTLYKEVKHEQEEEKRQRAFKEGQ